MPSGIELIYGVTHPRIADVCARLSTTLDLVSETGAPAHVDQALALAQRRILEHLGMSQFKMASGYLVAATPLGKRSFAPLVLEAFCVGEWSEQLEDEGVVLGVAVTSRYRPVCLDWRDDHGTMSPIVFDEGLRREMELCEQEIKVAVPELIGANWVVKEIWY